MAIEWTIVSFEIIHIDFLNKVLHRIMCRISVLTKIMKGVCSCLSCQSNCASEKKAEDVLMGSRSIKSIHVLWFNSAGR